MQSVTIDSRTGGKTISDVSEAKQTKRDAQAAAEAQAQAAEIAALEDISTRRAQIIADLRAIEAATTLAGVRAPLLRTLRFILRAMREQDDDA